MNFTCFFFEDGSFKARPVIGADSPFYFKWADESLDDYGSGFDQAAFASNDEDVFEFAFDQSEGDFPTLSVVIRNPRRALLSAEKLWCWFSYRKPDNSIVPLFHGRLVGIPDNIFGETVTLQFVARPTEYASIKTELAEAMKVAPFWDPVFISPDKLSDPDTIMQSRSELWHIDPVTLEVSTTDILIGEDGTEVFDESEVLYDTVSVRIGQPPLQSVHIEATVGWTQQGAGSVNLLHGAPFPVRNGSIHTFSYDVIQQSWPRDGSRIGDGWVATGTRCILLNDLNTTSANFDTKAKPVSGMGSGLQVVTNYSGSDDELNEIPDGSYFRNIDLGLVSEQTFGHSGKPGHLRMTGKSVDVVVAKAYLSVALSATFEASRDCTERVIIDMVADVQPVVVDAGDADRTSISLNSVNLSDDIVQPGVGVIETKPIGSVGSRSFITSTRGRQSIEYLLAIGRATLLQGSRVVETSFSTTFEKMLSMSLKKNATIVDSRLPNGTATGKVTRLQTNLNGDTGVMDCIVTMACAVGRDGEIAEVDGHTDYIADDYIDSGYYEKVGSVVVPAFGSVGYVPPAFAPNDDGLDLLNGIKPYQAFASPWTITNANPVLPEPDLNFTFKQQTVDDLLARMDLVPTEKHTFTLIPLSGQFETDYVIATYPLLIPKMIDLGG